MIRGAEMAFGPKHTFVPQGGLGIDHLARPHIAMDTNPLNGFQNIWNEMISGIESRLWIAGVAVGSIAAIWLATRLVGSIRQRRNEGDQWYRDRTGQEPPQDDFWHRRF